MNRQLLEEVITINIVDINEREILCILHNMQVIPKELLTKIVQLGLKATPQFVGMTISSCYCICHIHSKHKITDDDKAELQRVFEERLGKTA